MTKHIVKPVLAPAGAGPAAGRRREWFALFELSLLAGVKGLAVCSAAILFIVIGFVLQGAWPALHAVGLTRFFTDSSWHPTEGSFGLAPMLAASVASSLGALLIAVPVGVAIALFCRFYLPAHIGAAYKKALGVFAGVPSVIYGFWGLTVLVPFITEYRPPGASLLAGILILALMILPTIALTSETALAQVPSSYLQGGYALGMPDRSVLFKIALPAARVGIFSGVVLALARALGETMAILMVSGNLVQVPSSLFDPVRTLAANIALEMAYASNVHRSALFVSGVMLIGVVIAAIVVADRLNKRFEMPR